MNINNVKALADILNQCGLTALEVSEKDTKIRLEKRVGFINTQVEKKPAGNELVLPETDNTLDFNKITEVKSPLVGVFYSASSPDSEPFVTIGTKVKKGDVLCIIETMKVMNEISAESDGEIVDICVKNGDIAEYGQVLFKMF